MYAEWLSASSITVDLPCWYFDVHTAKKWLFSPSVTVVSPASPWAKQYNSRSWKGTQIPLQQMLWNVVMLCSVSCYLSSCVNVVTGTRGEVLRRMCQAKHKHNPVYRGLVYAVSGIYPAPLNEVQYMLKNPQNCLKWTCKYRNIRMYSVQGASALEHKADEWISDGGLPYNTVKIKLICSTAMLEHQKCKKSSPQMF